MGYMVLAHREPALRKPGSPLAWWFGVQGLKNSRSTAPGAFCASILLLRLPEIVTAVVLILVPVLRKTTCITVIAAYSGDDHLGIGSVASRNKIWLARTLRAAMPSCGT
jgi:hypothetical protein